MGLISRGSSTQLSMRVKTLSKCKVDESSPYHTEKKQCLCGYLCM